MENTSVAIMQPYFFPYIGYFQLINAVDKFVFYDDVNYISQGWINRNRIIINSEIAYITVHLKGASSNRLIKDLNIANNRSKLKKTIIMAYKNAPYFKQAWPVIESTMNYETDKISALAMYSVISVCSYLGVETSFETSSKSFPETSGLTKEDRLIEICKKSSVTNYINGLGGKDLYDKGYFTNRGITLTFLKSNLIPYQQKTNDFIPGLSIIDVMMNNSPSKITDYLLDFELI